MKLFLWPLIVLCTTLVADAQLSIGGFKTAYVVRPQEDPRGVYSRLSEQISRSGMRLSSSVDSLTEDERLVTCRVEFSQYGGLTQYCHITVRDLITNRVVTETTESCRARLGIGACISGSIEKAWKAVAYPGFTDNVHAKNISYLFPPRPVVEIDSIPELSPSNYKIEGRWIDAEGGLTMWVIRDPSVDPTLYLAVVSSSTSTLWRKGEVMAEIQEVAQGRTLSGIYYDKFKIRSGIALFLDESGVILRFDLQESSGLVKHHTWLKSSLAVIGSLSN